MLIEELLIDLINPTFLVQVLDITDIIDQAISATPHSAFNIFVSRENFSKSTWDLFQKFSHFKWFVIPFRFFSILR